MGLNQAKFQGYSRDSFFNFCPLAEGTQGKGKFSSSDVREFGSGPSDLTS